MIIFAKLTNRIFQKEDYNVYLMTITGGGERVTAVYVGEDPPQARKTVNYQLTGEMGKYKNKKQFKIASFERSKITIVKY